MGSMRVCTKSPAYMLWPIAWCFCGTSNSRSGCVSHSFVWFWDSFCCVALSSLDMKLFVLLIVFCFGVFGYHLFKAFFFLKGEGWVDPGRREMERRALGGVEKERTNCGWNVLYEKSVSPKPRKNKQTNTKHNLIKPELHCSVPILLLYTSYFPG